MRARVTKQPELQATSTWYGARTVLQHTPEQRKRRGYESREQEMRADQALNRLNSLFNQS